MPERERLPQQRKGISQSFKVGGLEGYIQTGEYSDGRLGEIFLTVSKQGSTIAGLMNSIAILTSIALQYGVPIQVLREKLEDIVFEPNGKTDDESIPEVSSIVDYVFRRLEADYAKG